MKTRPSGPASFSRARPQTSIAEIGRAAHIAEPDFWRGYPGPRISRRDRLPVSTDGPSHRSLPFEDYRPTYENEASHEVRLSHPCGRVPEIGPGFSGDKIPKRRSRLCGWDLSDPSRIGRIYFGLLFDWSVLIFSMFPFPGSYHFAFVNPRALDVKFKDPGGSAFILRVCVIGEESDRNLKIFSWEGLLRIRKRP